MEATLGLIDPIEHIAAVEVINKALALKAKRQDAFFDKLGLVVQNAIARAFKKG